MSTKGAPSSVAFGATFPISGKATKFGGWRLNFYHLNLLKNQQARKTDAGTSSAFPKMGKVPSGAEADEGAKFADIIRHLAIS